jgi:hypothetical protein
MQTTTALRPGAEAAEYRVRRHNWFVKLRRHGIVSVLDLAGSRDDASRALRR